MIDVTQNAMPVGSLFLVQFKVTTRKDWFSYCISCCLVSGFFIERSIFWTVFAKLVSKHGTMWIVGSLYWKPREDKTF